MYVRELTLPELLDDPMTVAVMAADRVDPVALQIVLSRLSLKFHGLEASGPGHTGQDRTGLEGYTLPACDCWPVAGAAPG